MKKISKLLIILLLLSAMFLFDSFAEVVKIPDTTKIEELTITEISGGKADKSDIVGQVNDFGFGILRILKVVLQGLIVIYLVYVGITMIISMGSDEDKLTKSKSQLRYALIAMVFINIPGTMYQAIRGEGSTTNIDGDIGDFDGVEAGEFMTEKNSILNIDLFGQELGVVGNIIGFMEVFIFGVAIFVIIMAGIKIMTSRGREEKITEAKNKILYSIFAMVFVGFVEAWKQLAITGNATFGTGVFGKMTDFALLFAGPVTIFFLTLAGYYYITSNGDEEKVKKAKSIVINTLIAIVLLVVMITFLNDLMEIGT